MYGDSEDQTLRCQSPLAPAFAGAEGFDKCCWFQSLEMSVTQRSGLRRKLSRASECHGPVISQSGNAVVRRSRPDSEIFVRFKVSVSSVLSFNR